MSVEIYFNRAECDKYLLELFKKENVIWRNKTTLQKKPDDVELNKLTKGDHTALAKSKTDTA